MKCNESNSSGLSDTQKTVLHALSQVETACGSKDIANSTGLEQKQVNCQLTALKKKGYVSSPVRCKYQLTAEGKAMLS